MASQPAMRPINQFVTFAINGAQGQPTKQKLCYTFISVEGNVFYRPNNQQNNRVTQKCNQLLGCRKAVANTYIYHG